MKKIVQLSEQITAVRVPSLLSYLPDTFVYILADKNGLVIIDTGGAGSGPLIMEGVRSMGFSGSDIGAVLLSHWHGDHTGGLAGLVNNIPGCQDLPVFIGEADMPYLESGQPVRLRLHPSLPLRARHKPGKLPQGRGERWGLFPVPASKDHNPLARWNIVPVHTPGHTEGHTAYYHESTGTLFAGCSLSLFSTHVAGIVPVHADRKAQLESAERIAALKFIHLCTAHFCLNYTEIPVEKRIPVQKTSSLVARITGSRHIFRFS